MCEEQAIAFQPHHAALRRNLVRRTYAAAFGVAARHIPALAARGGMKTRLRPNIGVLVFPDLL